MLDGLHSALCLGVFVVYKVIDRAQNAVEAARIRLEVAWQQADTRAEGACVKGARRVRRRGLG
jgi:hypothetical protein